MPEDVQFDDLYYGPAEPAAPGEEPAPQDPVEPGFVSGLVAGDVVCLRGQENWPMTVLRATHSPLRGSLADVTWLDADGRQRTATFEFLVLSIMEAVIYSRQIEPRLIDVAWNVVA